MFILFSSLCKQNMNVFNRTELLKFQINHVLDIILACMHNAHIYENIFIFNSLYQRAT